MIKLIKRAGLLAVVAAAPMALSACIAIGSKGNTSSCCKSGGACEKTETTTTVISR